MLLGEAPQTPLELRKRLPDVPLGTIYRHLNVLLECDVIHVVRERRIHGTVERQFALRAGADYFTDEQKKELLPQDVARIAGILTSLVSQSFERFAETATPPYRDGEFSMVATTLYLTQSEVQHFREFMKQFVAKEGRSPTPDLERRMVAFFSVPDPDFRPEC
jgi:hypothetical protein